MRHHANTAIKRNSTYDVALEVIEECLSSPVMVETEFETNELARLIESFRWVWQGSEKEANLSEDLLAELQTLLGSE